MTARSPTARTTGPERLNGGFPSLNRSTTAVCRRGRRGDGARVARPGHVAETHACGKCNDRGRGDRGCRAARLPAGRAASGGRQGGPTGIPGLGGGPPGQIPRATPTGGCRQAPQGRRSRREPLRAGRRRVRRGGAAQGVRSWRCGASEPAPLGELHRGTGRLREGAGYPGPPSARCAEWGRVLPGGRLQLGCSNTSSVIVSPSASASVLRLP